MSDDTETTTAEQTDDGGSLPDLKDVRRDSEVGKLLAWKWVFTILFTIVGVIGTITYFVFIGMIQTEITITATFDIGTQLAAAAWVIVVTIALVSFIAIIRIAGIGFINSLIDILHKIRFED